MFPPQKKMDMRILQNQQLTLCNRWKSPFSFGKTAGGGHFRLTGQSIFMFFAETFEEHVIMNVYLPSWERSHIPSQRTFKDELPVPKVGYVSSLEGM